VVGSGVAFLVCVGGVGGWGWGGGGGDYITSRYLPTVDVLGARWYSFMRARCRKSM